MISLKTYDPEELVCRGVESDELDYKAAMNWNTMSRAAKGKILRPRQVYTGYTEPAAVTSNELGTKVGQASAVSVLGVAAAGDAGINEAAKKAVEDMDICITKI